jgi:hypothetical protein
MLEGPRFCKNHFFKPGAKVSQTEANAESPPFKANLKFKLPRLGADVVNLKDRLKEVRKVPERRLMNIFGQDKPNEGNLYALKMLTSPSVRKFINQTPKSPS